MFNKSVKDSPGYNNRPIMLDLIYIYVFGIP
jgi:hypothetical protein